MSQELPKPHAPALFDHDECERWLSTARRQLDTARALTSGAFHESAVLHAEQAPQCALKGLLHAVGAVREARGHSLLDLTAACEERAALDLPDGVRAALGELAAQHQPSRYPDALPGGYACGPLRDGGGREGGGDGDARPRVRGGPPWGAR